MSLLTRCTHCHTVFRITTEQLQAHGGQVRCGRCMQVFNGMAALAPDAPAEPVPAAGAALPMVEEAQPPIVAAAAETDTGTVAGEETATEAETLIGPSPETVAVEPVAAHADADPPSDISPDAPSGLAGIPPEVEPEPQPLLLTAVDAENPFIREEPVVTEKPAPRRPWLAAAGVLMGMVLAMQAVFFYRGEIAARHPLARDWLNMACAYAGCTVPLPRAIKTILIEASDLQLVDPARPERIQLTATLRNHASHAAAYPALDLVLTNANDHTLARRIFLPAEYLGGGRDPLAGISANEELTVRLVLETGNLGAAGFRLAILPAPLR